MVSNRDAVRVCSRTSTEDASAAVNRDDNLLTMHRPSGILCHLSAVVSSSSVVDGHGDGGGRQPKEIGSQEHKTRT